MLRAHSTTTSPGSSPKRSWNSIKNAADMSRKRQNAGPLSSHSSDRQPFHNQRSRSIADFFASSRTFDQAVSTSNSKNHESSMARSDRTENGGPRFVIGVDFGTTFTAIAFRRGEDNRIHTIENFPDDPSPGTVGKQVPSESWYPLQRTKRNTKKDKISDMTVRKESQQFAGNMEAYFEGPPASAQSNKRNICPGYLYGFQVQSQLEVPEEEQKHHSPVGRLSRMKLLLDRGPVTQELRRQLNETLISLKHKGFINKSEDALQHYLSALFVHVKRELEVKHSLSARDKVEVVFSIPVCWDTAAASTMQRVMTRALQVAELSGNSRGDICNLFMVTEPEAAATYAVLSSDHDLKRGETFILLDCGGGTIDAAAFRVSHSDPLRLDEEVINPKGVVAGSCYLNEEMRKFAMLNLKSETYLEETGITIEHIIETQIMPKFELETKRSADFADKEKRYFFSVRGLRKSQTNRRILKDCFVLNYHDLFAIFTRCLKPISEILESQIQHAKVQNIEIDKVVIVGGFGDSPALQTFIRGRLKDFISAYGMPLHGQPITPRLATSATGVAVGAIHRALDKAHGPKRTLRKSIGVLRHLPYEPEAIKEFPELAPILEGKAIYDRVDDIYLVENTILWVIKKGQGAIESRYEGSYDSTFTFPSEKQNWRAKEVLYESETCVEDYYQRGHKKNRGKTTSIGHVVLDFNHLKGHVERTIPRGGGCGKPRYDINVRVEFLLVDRDLSFKCRWPASANGDLVQSAQKSFSVVASFEPGTN